MKVLDAISALGNHYTGANPATPDQAGHVPVLKFIAGSDQFAEFLMFLPDYYSGAGLTFEVFSQASSATSGNYAWEIAISSLTPGTDPPSSKGFAAVQSSGAVATHGSAGVMKQSTVVLTAGGQMDNWVAGEWAKVRINRDTGIASNLSGDLELLAIVMKETGT